MPGAQPKGIVHRDQHPNTIHLHRAQCVMHRVASLFDGPRNAAQTVLSVSASPPSITTAVVSACHCWESHRCHLPSSPEPTHAGAPCVHGFRWQNHHPSPAPLLDPSTLPTLSPPTSAIAVDALTSAATTLLKTSRHYYHRHDRTMAAHQCRTMPRRTAHHRLRSPSSFAGPLPLPLEPCCSPALAVVYLIACEKPAPELPQP